MSSTTTIDSVIYTLSDTNAVISGFDNGTAPSSWSLIIQSTVTYLDNIYNVTSIENYAFNIIFVHKTVFIRIFDNLNFQLFYQTFSFVT